MAVAQFFTVTSLNTACALFIMPKAKCSDSVKLRGFVREFGEKLFSTDGKILFCKLCEVKVSAEKRFNVQQHCNTAKHTNCMKRSDENNRRQMLLFEQTGQSSTVQSFCKDFCKMMVSYNIPLEKVKNPCFRRFLEKYTTHPVPDESTLRKNYLSVCYNDVLTKIRITVAEQKIWLSIDETTDVSGRYIANVVVGVLKVDGPGDIFLLTCEALDRVNKSTIAILFDNSLNLLWPDGVKSDNVLLFVTDAASYMAKAAKGIQILYLSMVYVTCLAHALHRVKLP